MVNDDGLFARQNGFRTRSVKQLVSIGKILNFDSDGHVDDDSQGSHSDWKTWKNGKAFSSQGILTRLEKSWKITQNTGKLREFQTNIGYSSVTAKLICILLLAKCDNVFS